MSVSRRRFCQAGASAGLLGVLPSAGSANPSTASTRSVPSRISCIKLSGEATSIEGSAVRELAQSLAGQLLLRGDFGYDGVRRIWNGMHDRYPALIVRARSPADFAHAVTFARERELLLAVKGGGHSWPGQSVADDALMIDLSELAGVIVDPAACRARVGGGALLYDLDLAALRHNLATTATPASAASRSGEVTAGWVASSG